MAFWENHWGYTATEYIHFRKFFSWAAFTSEITCVNLEPFKSSKASNMKGPKWSIRSPFLTPHVEIPKDIDTRTEGRSTVVQNFTPIDCNAAEISYPGTYGTRHGRAWVHFL